MLLGCKLTVQSLFIVFAVSCAGSRCCDPSKVWVGCSLNLYIYIYIYHRFCDSVSFGGWDVRGQMLWIDKEQSKDTRRVLIHEE